MNKDKILELLRADFERLKIKYGVKSIGLFGSYSKDLQLENSDIDFLVELDPPYAANFFGLWDYLEKRFDKKIDLTRCGSHLRENFIDTINKEILYV
jgi:uncharacterized protein